MAVFSLLSGSGVGELSERWVSGGKWVEEGGVQEPGIVCRPGRLRFGRPDKEDGFGKKQVEGLAHKAVPKRSEGSLQRLAEVDGPLSSRQGWLQIGRNSIPVVEHPQRSQKARGIRFPKPAGQEHDG